MNQPPSIETPSREPSTLTDPVCGMTVDPATAAGTAEHEGRTYGFCCRGCLERFRAAPAEFVGRPGAAGPGVAVASEWTCPMHPEVRRPGAGTGVAYADSVVATVAPRLFPAAFRGSEGEVPVYFEVAAVITVLVLLGQVLELKARGRTSQAIRVLLGLQPKTARRLTEDGQ